MSNLKYVGVQEFPIDDLENNPLSANEEDSSTFERLKHEQAQYGMLEIPVAIRSSEKANVRILSGHHRVRAWKELGHKTVQANLFEGKLSKEEEFSLVNNLNQIRGSITMSTVKRVIRTMQLDVTAIDLFKMPVQSMMPKASDSAANEDMQRRARLRDMAIKISGELAEIIVDNRDEDLVCFAYEGKLVAVLHIQHTPQKVRGNASVFKGILERVYGEWEEEVAD